MNIGIACPRFLWAGGGSVLYTQRCAEEWVQRGHTVTVLTDAAPPDKKDARRPELKGYTVRELTRDEGREKRYSRMVALQHRRGGYRLAQMLLRSGKRLLGAQGPWCSALADAATWEGFDVAVVVNSGSTAFGFLAADGLRSFSGRTAAVPLFHPREEFAEVPH